VEIPNSTPLSYPSWQLNHGEECYKLVGSCAGRNATVYDQY